MPFVESSSYGDDDEDQQQWRGGWVVVDTIAVRLEWTRVVGYSRFPNSCRRHSGGTRCDRPSTRHVQITASFRHSFHIPPPPPPSDS